MKNIAQKLYTVGLTVVSTVMAAPVMASRSAAEFIAGIHSAGSKDLITFIEDALNTIIALAALIAVGVLIYSGIRYILAAGDDKKVQEATNGITYSVIGLVICFISLLIVQFVLSALLGQKL